MHLLCDMLAQRVCAARQSASVYFAFDITQHGPHDCEFVSLWLRQVFPSFERLLPAMCHFDTS